MAKLKVLIVFGSKSDDFVFQKIFDGLKDFCECELRICSAHRTPEMLDEILKTEYDVIIAGAGLAAHLPGVCASKSLCPVVGVPVRSNFKGLDSLLSIMQMPPGIPVLSVGVNNHGEAINAVKLFSPEYKGVKLEASEENQGLIEEARNQLKLFGISEDERGLPIRFISVHSNSTFIDRMAVYCPVSEDRHIPAEQFLNLTRHGLWVGLNRVENAVISAAQVLAIRNKGIKKKLISYREKMALKVVEDDNSIRVKGGS